MLLGEGGFFPRIHFAIPCPTTRLRICNRMPRNPLEQEERKKRKDLRVLDCSESNQIRIGNLPGSASSCFRHSHIRIRIPSCMRRQMSAVSVGKEACSAASNLILLALPYGQGFSLSLSHPAKTPQEAGSGVAKIFERRGKKANIRSAITCSCQPSWIASILGLQEHK